MKETAEISQKNFTKEPLRIAIDIREAGHEKTGKGWYTYNLVHSLLKIDSHNEYIFYTDQNKNPFKEFKNAHIRTIPGKSLMWHFNVIKDLKKTFANGLPFDLFFAPTSYIIPCFAPKNLRVIITVHDLVAFLFPSTHNTKAVIIERLTLKKALKKAAKVFVVSQNTENDLLTRFQYPKEKIHEVPCAPADFYKEEISEKELTTFKKKHKLPDRFILAVGTLEPRKNFSTLIKSFVIIKRRNPDCKLVIVGKKGWKYSAIEDALKKYQLENDVIFPGYLEDDELRKTYHLASVFVFPSLYEGFGIPPLEAMSCGCPVVSSNVASLPEVIGDSGLLIDPKNAHKWADAVCSLLDNEQTRNMLIERGKRRAEKFSWENSAKIALEVFESFAR